jgi:hypothetical protein
VKLFSIGTHASLLEEIAGTLRRLGHVVETVSFSAHEWIFGRQPAASCGPITKENWSTSDPAAFARWFAPRAGEFDAVIASYPASMAMLFRDVPKPIIVYAAARYEGPWQEDAEKWGALNDFLLRDDRVRLAANSYYDQAYLAHFLGREPVRIPCRCDYVGGARWRAYDGPLLAKSRDSKALTLALAKVPNLRTMGSHYSWSDLARALAIVHLPYNASTMSGIEQYRMGIPLMVPTPDFLLALRAEVGLLSELSWPRHDRSSCIPGDPNGGSDANVREWIKRADYYAAPGVIQFGSWEHLRDLLAHADFQAQSAIMRQHNEHERELALERWDDLLRELV